LKENKSISCPWCNWGESDNEINIARHFEKEHEYKALLKLAKMLLEQENKAVPISTIDAKIAEVEEYDDNEKWYSYEVVQLFVELKKEAKCQI
jgi:hypothetical protein